MEKPELKVSKGPEVGLTGGKRRRLYGLYTRTKRETDLIKGMDSIGVSNLSTKYK